MDKYQKIQLNISGGPIVFIGSMNAMPMMYALELKKKGFDIIYFVDAPVSDKLSRPENHFADITYPYPYWVVEVDIKTQMFIPYFRGLFAKVFESKVRKITKKEPQAYILNGFFISLLPFLSKLIPKIALSHGSDLHSWADVEGADNLSNSFYKYSFFRWLPKVLARNLIKIAVSRQFDGFCSSDIVLYFPRGFNSNGDRVIDNLEKLGVAYYGRYDISFEPILKQSRAFKDNGDQLIIFSGVRFTFETFSEGNAKYSKGNDHIINGLARFYQDHTNLVVHFVEKGPDVEKAKLLCKQTGLGSAVIWHKEMKFIELLEIYNQADICFDQVGGHWIGAIGGYALWLGKPLIANDRLPVDIGFWPKDNPVCSASNAEEVHGWLLKLNTTTSRKKISEESKIFVEEYMSPDRIMNDIFVIKGSSFSS